MAERQDAQLIGRKISYRVIKGATWAIGFLLALTFWSSQALAINTSEIVNLSTNTSYIVPGADLVEGGANGTIVIGGYAGAESGANASGNILTVNTNVSNVSVVGGANINASPAAGAGNVSNNIVNVYGNVGVVDPSNNLYGKAIGGASNVSEAWVKGNTVNVYSGGLVHHDVVGGVSKTNGYAVENKVNIIDGTAYRDVYGGVADNGTAANNSVLVDGGNVGDSTIGYRSKIIGGQGYNAVNNTVTINNSAIWGNIMGGRVSGVNGSATAFSSTNNNTVIISGGSNITGDVIGGEIDDVHLFHPTNTSASYNKVIIRNGNITNGSSGSYGLVLGARSDDNVTGQLHDNEVQFESGWAALVAGGYSQGNSTNVTSNIVNITGGQITYTLTTGLEGVYGGLAGETGTPSTGIVSGNKVYFTNANTTNVYGGKVVNGTGEVSFNEVHLYGANVNVTHEVIGGESDTGNVTSNLVNITGGSQIGNDVIGGLSDSGNVTSNIVNIVNITGDSKIIGNVIGGDSTSGNVVKNLVNVTGGEIGGNVSGGNSATGLVDQNYVYISGGVVNESVYGGYASGLTNVTNNTVYLTGGVEIGDDVIGGYASATGSNLSKNTVILAGAQVNGSVFSADGFNSTDNDIIFASGNNTVYGAVNATGDLLVENGKNLLNSTTNAFNVEIKGGNTTFIGDLNVTAGNITVTGGEVTFANITDVDNLTTTGGLSVFDGSDITATGAVNFGLLSTQDILGNVSITSPSNVTLGGNSTLNFNSGSNLSLTNGLVTTAGTKINVRGDSEINVVGNPGLDISGTLDLGLSDFDVYGNATFRDKSTMRVGHNLTSGAQGSLYVSETLKVEGDVFVEPATDAIPDETQAIIIVDSVTGAFDDLAGNFTSDVLNIDYDSSTGEFSANLKDPEKIFEKYDDNLNRNDYRIAVLMSRVIDDWYTNQRSEGLTKQIVNLLTAATNLARNNPGQAHKIIERVLKQNNGESVLSVHNAVTETALKTQGVVFGRLDRIHETLSAVPPAAGDPDAFNRVWVGGFGSWARQKNRDHIYGYDFNLGGFSLGYDRRVEALPGLRLGVSTSFSFGKIESKNNWGEVDVDTVGLGLYGSYLFDNGFFIDANFAYAHSENDSTINLLGGGRKTGNFDVDTWQLGARAGMIFDLGTVKLTPTVGLRYLKLKQDGFTERQSAVNPLSIPNVFNKK
ncbi:MAG: autotransporter outer membrane beta-barrel domain-containing protein, partial [Deltaproteobacteria bacterium]|nr:autotransporter outer membrane beta-barrel domain-containing protein [Deltaproteobacteria bacterium]